MHKDVKDLVEYGQKLGFGAPELQGNGHYRMIHDNGQAVTIAATPSDGRGRLNAIADMHRVAELPAQKPNAAKLSFKKEHSRLNVARSEIEERAIDRAHRLASEWDEVIARLQQLSDYYDAHGRNRSDDALGWVLWQKFDEIEADLATLGRLPSTAIPWPRVTTHDEYVDLWLGRWPEAPVAGVTLPEGFAWSEPPQERRARQPRTDWAAVIDALKAAPGVWVRRDTSVASSMISKLKGKHPGLEARGKTDTERRGYYSTVWLRWAGDPS